MMYSFMKTLKKIFHVFSYNILKTIYFNFRVLPFHEARHLPIKIGYHVDIIGLCKGCVRINKKNKLRRGMIKLGITPLPMISTKGQYTLLRFNKGGRMIFGENVHIHNGVSLIVSEGGMINIGSDSMINQHTKIYANKAVNIGNHCRIGWECQILDSDCHLVYNDNKKTISTPIHPIHIGDNVWIASRSTIMKGVTIPSFSIISGNSLVNRSFADITTSGNIFAGSPATLKATGFYRLLDGKFEFEMKQHFLSSEETVFDTSEIVNFNYTDYLF